MRFEGTLKTWNDQRGFGFIEPTQGGQDIFVHIEAFGPRGGRPWLRSALFANAARGVAGFLRPGPCSALVFAAFTMRPKARAVLREVMRLAGSGSPGFPPSRE